MQRSSATVTFNFPEVLAFQQFAFEMGHHDHRSPEEAISLSTHTVRFAFANSEDPEWRIDPADLESVLAFAAECFGGGA
jgi:hypothetical protein